MIALLCAVPAECWTLRSALNASSERSLGGKTLITGTLGMHSIALCAGGMGKANAAHAATLLITSFSPDTLIIFGVGGAYPSADAKVGDLAVATAEIAGDEGVITNEGFRDAEFIGIPLVAKTKAVRYNLFPVPSGVTDRLLQILPASGLTTRSGRFVTLSTCTGTSTRARELERLYGDPLCENMEGAAAAQVAELHDIPWIELRGISNIVEDRDLSKWDIPRAAAAAQDAVKLLLERWQD